jgi:thiol-disulfide isomerase/thioredoxin
MRVWYTIFLVALFGGIMLYVMRYLYQKYNARKLIVAQDSDSTKVKTCELFYFYTTWCPYCNKAKPEWEAFRSEWEGKPFKGYYITFTEVDCDVDETTAKKYDVKSYPTIKLKCKGEVFEYDARPTKEDLTRFLNSVLP